VGLIPFELPIKKFFLEALRVLYRACLVLFERIIDWTLGLSEISLLESSNVKASLIKCISKFFELIDWAIGGFAGAFEPK
jgi:hypothetical protein